MHAQALAAAGRDSAPHLSPPGPDAATPKGRPKIPSMDSEGAPWQRGAKGGRHKTVEPARVRPHQTTI